eukprot:358571-Rhodomonas_salina.1
MEISQEDPTNRVSVLERKPQSRVQDMMRVPGSKKITAAYARTAHSVVAYDSTRTYANQYSMWVPGDGTVQHVGTRR